MIGSKQRLLLTYLASLFIPAKRQVLLSVLITAFLGLAKGGSFMTLLPILQVAHITEITGEHSRAVDLITQIWATLGLSVSLISCLIGYVLLVTVYSLLGYVKALIDSEVNQQYKQYLRNTLFDAVVNAEWGFIKRSDSHSINNNLLTEVDTVGYMTHLIIQSLTSGMILLIYFITSLYLSWKMTLIAILCFVPLFLIQRRFNTKSYTLGEDLYKRHEHLFKAVSEFIGSLKFAKSSNLEAVYLDDFKAINTQMAEDVRLFTKTTARTGIVYEIGSAITVSVVLVWAIVLLNVPPLDLLVMIYIASRLLPTISTLTRNFQYVLNALPAFEGLTTLVTEAQKHQENSNPQAPERDFPQHSIAFVNISFGYDQGPLLFDGFNCIIPINQTTLLTGPSGVGKSTLVELLLGLLKPRQGQIVIDGISLDEYNLKQWRQSIAYIPQECFLFNTTIRKNLLWSKPEATDDDLQRALTLVAGAFVLKLPDGMETVVGDQGIKLSGGERQRIALARAILRNPKLLIIDEATNALDSENESIINDSLARLEGKVTIVIISHNEKLRHKKHYTIRVKSRM